MSLAHRAGTVLPGRLTPHVEEAVAAVHAAVIAEFPVLERLPAEMWATIRHAVGILLRRELTLAARNEPWTDEDLAFAGEQGRLSAAHGVSGDMLDRCLRICVSASLRTFWSAVDETGTEEVLALSAWVHRNLAPARRVVAREHRRELIRLRGSAQVRHLLAEQLVCGTADLAVPAVGGHGSTDSFLVVVVRGAPADAEPPDTVLWVVDDADLVLLVASPDTDPERRTAESTARDVVGRLAARAPRLAAGKAWAARPCDVPQARAEAGRVARLAGATGDHTRLHGADDVVLESAVAQAGPAADRLAGLLDVLEARPELLATLETFFAHDYDRTRSARALFLHRRTLQLRLHRICQLTGHSPTTARGSLVLNAALSARRLRPS
ncbi:helix-turn-helix domain-containing protein [Micromonospora sp. C31]|uniref:PucR family transcriptional regulator n=1 Tax=Micromonospora sp. C31 TaxID=2824876 RepID=UPI001B39573A|nr:helix-turn-helix domain-containing protein [Micromonospora sp. C31]MBQ1073972.1 helix-turn-helix domain-containing protein [Micromonospora sp. C31]